MVIRVITILIAVINYGFMLFDGSHALIKGDYIRPASGKFAGQLGPWSQLVQSIGIAPESTFMKSVFVVWGIIGLYITTSFAMNPQAKWKTLLIFSLLSAWNLYVGTMACAIVIALLVLARLLK